MGNRFLYKNEFTTKLVVETLKRFPSSQILTEKELPIVYGEGNRMATLIIRVG